MKELLYNLTLKFLYKQELEFTPNLPRVERVIDYANTLKEIDYTLYGNVVDDTVYFVMALNFFSENETLIDNSRISNKTVTL